MTGTVLRLTTTHLSDRGREAWHRYNATGMPVAGDSVLQQFSASVRCHGQRAAVADESRCLSYSALDERSDRVAGGLSALGVTAGDLVGILDGRCVSTYVGLLAVLKAGATYVPLNPGDPPARLAAIAADCSLVAVVSPGAHAFPEHASKLVALPIADVQQLVTGTVAREYRAVPVKPSRPAYVIYTSGSTGAPKGVRIRHHSVVNLAAWMRDRCGVLPGDNVAQTARLFFDPSVQQIFPAWTSGACLNPVPPDLLLDPLRMMDWLALRKITHLDMVTPHWAGIAAALEASGAELPLELPDLRWIIVGGDSMHYEHVMRWRRVIDGPGRVLNVYGPTEATVNATECVPDEASTAGKVPIGRPLPNYELFLIDDDGGICPPYSRR